MSTFQTLATRANMRAVEAANPGRTIRTPDGPAHIEGRRAIAWSPLTDETASASSGDYFNLPEGEPLRDSEGEPMVLVFERRLLEDALSGEPS